MALIDLAAFSQNVRVTCEKILLQYRWDYHIEKGVRNSTSSLQYLRCSGSVCIHKVEDMEGIVPSEPLKTLASYVLSKEDIKFEQQLLKSSDSIELWFSYLEHKKKSYAEDISQQIYVLSRAVGTLPRSYKLWMAYIKLRQQVLDQKFSVFDSWSLQKSFEKCLLTLGKFVEAWLLYLSFLIKYTGPVFTVTFTRHTFNSAYKALPLTQHNRIWPLFLSFASMTHGKTAFIIYSRFFEYKCLLPNVVINEKEINEDTKIDNDLNVILEGLKNSISSVDEIDRLSEIYDTILNGKKKLMAKLEVSELELYNDYIDTLAKFCGIERKTQLNINREYQLVNTIEQLILKFPDQLSSFIVKLAKYWISTKEFHKARSTFEKGIERSLTIRDFTVVFNSYIEFEDAVMTKLAHEVDGNPGAQLEEQLNLAFERFERLMAKRSLLINDVQLRQNANNVETWLKRVELFDPKTQLNDIRDIYQEAIKSIDVRRALSNDLVAGSEGSQAQKLVKLWVNYAKMYKDNDDTDTMRTIFSTAVKLPFKFPDDLADVYIAWCEEEDLETAKRVLEDALKICSPSIAEKANIRITQDGRNTNVQYHDSDLSAQLRLHKSIKLWNYYLDLVEGANLDDGSCSSEMVMDIYERIVDLKIATPLTFVSYTNYLEGFEYYEKSLKVFEKSVQMFSFPTVFELWNVYLSKIIEYQKFCNISIERVRDLFFSFFKVCPPNLAKPIYLAYADYEADKGYRLRALEIYQEALQKVEVDDESLIDIYKIYIAKSVEFEGLPSARKIYSDALERLEPTTPNYVQVIFLGFISIEESLEEYKRVRELFKYGSELLVKVCDSSTYLIRYGKRLIEDRDLIWAKWKEFELQQGNEETYKEMLRYKRHITANSNDNLLETLQRSAAGVAAQTGQTLAPASIGPIGFVASTTINAPKVEEKDNDRDNPQEPVVNEDRIDLDIDDISSDEE